MTQEQKQVLDKHVAIYQRSIQVHDDDAVWLES